MAVRSSTHQAGGVVLEKLVNHNTTCPSPSPSPKKVPEAPDVVFIVLQGPFSGSGSGSGSGTKEGNTFC